MIRGNYLFNDTPLIVPIVSVQCILLFLLVCVKCPVNFGNADFESVVVCLPLEYMYVIFDMN